MCLKITKKKFCVKLTQIRKKVLYLQKKKG